MTDSPARTRWLMVALVFCMAVLMFIDRVNILIAQVVPHVEPPSLVRFVGTLHPVEEEGRWESPTLVLALDGVRWRLRITKVEKLTGRAVSGLRLLESLFPPQVRLTGPEEFLRPLRGAEIAGKSLMIEGRLYMGDRTLFVAAIGEVSGRSQ